MIEAIVGHFVSLHKKLYFGKKHGSGYVELKRVNNKKLHVDLDLAASIDGPDPGVDVDFDLFIECNNSRVNISTANLKVKVKHWSRWLPAWLGDAAAWVVSMGQSKFHLFSQDERLVVDARLQVGERGVATVGFAQLHRGHGGRWMGRDTQAE